MKRIYQKSTWMALAFIAAISACGKSDDVVPDIPPSDGTVMTLEGKEGDDTNANVVYVDLSTEQQTAVARDSWTLGFYNGDDFKVILNNHFSVTALLVEDDDLAEVSSATVDVNDLAIGIDFMSGQVIGDFSLIDDTAGTYDPTAIAPVSETASENEIYIVNAVGGSTVNVANVYKVQIQRSANGYTLHYAQIDETDIQTLEIPKDADYNFSYVSLQGGNIVNIEPVKADWDISWGYNLYFTSMGGPALPYGMADFIQLNSQAGVQAAEVLQDEVSFDAFAEANLSGISFSSARNFIGANWRTVGMSSSSVKNDRYYLIKDVAGNIYKLKFNSMGTGDSGERGRPEIEFSLVQRG